MELVKGCNGCFGQRKYMEGISDQCIKALVVLILSASIKELLSVYCCFYYKAELKKRIQFLQKLFSNNGLYVNIDVVFETTYYGKEDDIIEL
jgi:hypothetical protein